MKILLEIRNELLSLHKTLLEIEREVYEEKNGAISNVKLLSLLFEDDSFVWLRDISILVAEIDELFGAKNGFDFRLAVALNDQVKSLFDDSPNHRTFKKAYQAHLKAKVSVAAHHENLCKLLTSEEI